MEATSGFEPLNNCFADSRLATWLRRRIPLARLALVVIDAKAQVELSKIFLSFGTLPGGSRNTCINAGIS